MADAARLCRAVAELRGLSRQPLVIAGPHGAGKTRLLNETARVLRARPGNLLLACVSPLHFSEEVAALAHDPQPLRRAQNAVLLVDGMERFGPSESRLEPVMRQFMNHGGYVVVTTQVHPWGLTNIREGLRLLLTAGEVVEVGSVPGAAAGPDLGQSRRSLNDLIEAARRQAEVATLASNRLRSAVETHQIMIDRALALFDRANAEARADRSRLEGARERLYEVRGLLEELSDSPHTSAAAAASLAEKAVLLVRRAVHALDMSLARAGERDRLLEILARIQKRQNLEFSNLLEHRRTAAAEAAGLHAMTVWLESALARAEAEHASVSEALARVLAAGEKRLRVRGGARSLAARVIRLQEEKQISDGRLERLSEQLTQRQEAVLRGRMELQALTGHNESLLAELDEYRDHIGTLQQRVGDQGREIAQLRERRASARAEAERAEAVALDLERRLEKALDERAAYRSQLRLAEGDRSALVRQMAQMKQERDRDRAARLQAESALRALRKPVVRPRAVASAIGLDTPALRDGSAQEPKKPEIVSLAEERRKKRLGELLCDAGRITRDQLSEALRLQGKEKPVRVGAILVACGYVDEETIVETVARQLGVLFLRLDRAQIIPAAARLVDAADARKHQYIPLSRHGGELTIAMADPLNREAIAMIEEATKLKVRVVAAPPADIARAQESCYAA